MRKNFFKMILGFALVLLTVVGASADDALPGVYRAYLTTVSGEEVQASSLPIIFRIYLAPSGGALVWEETLTVRVDNGALELAPGAGVADPGIYDPDPSAAEEAWFELEVDGDALSPRRRIARPGDSFRMQGAYYVARFAGMGKTGQKRADDLSDFFSNDSDDPVKADPSCFDNMNRYVDCGNGAVSDAVTGLIWLKNANCFGTKNFADANNAAAGLKNGDCGLTDNSMPGDWRLPTQAEWENTVAVAVALKCDDPSLTDIAGTGCYSALAQEEQPFFGIQSNGYWSCTTYDNLPTYAWGVVLYEISTGYIDKENMGYVWPVRDG
ncbi:MAG: DUF1566 domain-containing protein, partial [Desulfobacterales bacterium]|nr:DUF1566 domain-containing protein [Desulfobacterales bacterium]